MLTKAASLIVVLLRLLRCFHTTGCPVHESATPPARERADPGRRDVAQDADRLVRELHRVRVGSVVDEQPQNLALQQAVLSMLDVMIFKKPGALVIKFMPPKKSGSLLH